MQAEVRRRVLRRVLAAVVPVAVAASIATTVHAQTEQGPLPTELVPQIVTRTAIPPLGLFALGTVGCVAAAPIAGTILLGRAMTASEVGRSTLGCALGPVGWLIGLQLFPLEVLPIGPGNTPANVRPAQGNGNIHQPPAGETHFVPDEVLIVFGPGVSAQYLARLARVLHVTLLETQTFGLTGITLQRWHIDNGRSVSAILRALARFAQVGLAQPNYLYLIQQGAPAAMRAPDAGSAQYVVGKLHLTEAHQISNGDDVPVAVLDSKIDVTHPDLAGAVGEEFDAVGGEAPPHPHGTGMAGAIAAHAKLVGVAPKVRLLAARVFAGSGDMAQGTTFNILKGLDWAASKNARIVNMSFAGPNDPLLRGMIAKAHTRGMTLIAAVGNAGPRSGPLYPAAYPDVIGVTATDIDDKVMPQANHGRQVALSAPGVDVLVPAPGGSYQLTTGTSIAAANASGVAALLLARDAKLTPEGLRKILTGSARGLGRPAQEVGSGEIDALAALRAQKK